MLKVLLKKQFAEMFRGFFYDQKKKTARSKTSVALWIIMYVFIMVGVLGGTFGTVAYGLCGPMTEAGVSWLYFAIMGLISLALGVFGSVFNTHAALYLPKDNDLLLSLPIPPRILIASRLLGVYLLGLMYSGCVLLPTVIVYWVFGSFTLASALGSLMLVLIISVIVLCLACLLGFVVAKVSLRLKNKSFVTVALSLLLVGGYYFVYFKAQTLIRTLAQNAAVYGERIKGSARILYFFGRIGEGDPAAIGAFTLGVAAFAALTWLLLSKSFFNIAGATGTVNKAVYKEKRAKAASPAAALLRKEFARFISSPLYMLNCGLGVIFLPAAGIAMLLKGNVLVDMLSDVFSFPPEVFAVLFTAAVCMLGSMNDIAAPSVSLEGKTLWQVKSLPVTAVDVLKAKMKPQLLLTLPAVAFCYACAAFVLRGLSLPVLLLGAGVALSYTLLSSLFGLFLGLKMPMLDWTTEVIPIKQSMGVTIALFSGWGYALVFGGGYLLLAKAVPAAIYLGVFFALTLCAALLIYRWILTKGARIFEAL